MSVCLIFSNGRGSMFKATGKETESDKQKVQRSTRVTEDLRADGSGRVRSRPRTRGGAFCSESEGHREGPCVFSVRGVKKSPSGGHRGEEEKLFLVVKCVHDKLL